MDAKTFLPGDRVEYAGAVRSLLGEVGTVDKQVSTATVRVRWDTRSTPTLIYPESLRLVSRPLPDTNELQVGAGSVSDPLHEALQRLIKAKIAVQRVIDEKLAVMKEEQAARTAFERALGKAARE